MEKGVAALDFETTDQMLQVHGKATCVSPSCTIQYWLIMLDYEGVGLSSRDANSKKAAAEATAIFQNYYPEFLVSVSNKKFNSVLTES